MIKTTLIADTEHCMLTEIRDGGYTNFNVIINPHGCKPVKIVFKSSVDAKRCYDTLKGGAYISAQEV